MRNIRHIKLDKYEQEIEENIEKSSKLLDVEVKKQKILAEQAAHNYLRNISSPQHHCDKN